MCLVRFRLPGHWDIDPVPLSFDPGAPQTRRGTFGFTTECGSPITSKTEKLPGKTGFVRTGKYPVGVLKLITADRFEPIRSWKNGGSNAGGTGRWTDHTYDGGSNLIQRVHRPAQQPVPTKSHLNLPPPQLLTKSKPAITIRLSYSESEVESSTKRKAGTQIVISPNEPNPKIGRRSQAKSISDRK
jgi:hypothetical protein